MGVAICSKLIYRREFRELGDDIYAAGLLHDIGIIVEDQFFTEQFDQALSTVMSEIRNLHEVENETLNINHAQIGKAIADQLKIAISKLPPDAQIEYFIITGEGTNIFWKEIELNLLEAGIIKELDKVFIPEDPAFTNVNGFKNLARKILI